MQISYSNRYNEGCVTYILADTSRLLIINKERYRGDIQYITPELIYKERYFDRFASNL